MNKKSPLAKNKARGDFLRFSNYVELTPDFEKALSTNFCAKKYFYELPEHKQIHIAQKAKRLSETELKEYVTELGNIIN